MYRQVQTPRGTSYVQIQNTHLTQRSSDVSAVFTY